MNDLARPIMEALAKTAGVGPLRIWLDPHRIELLRHEAGLPIDNQRHAQNFANVPVARCIPHDPGERVIARDGTAYKITA